MFELEENKDMKTYDKAGTCIKCGYGGIEDVHCDEVVHDLKLPYAKLYRSFNQGKDLEDIPEHIARTCKNCGYSWNEKPLDEEGNHIHNDDFEIGDHTGWVAPAFEVGDILTVGDGDECEHELLARLTEDWWCVSGYDKLFNKADLHDHFSLLRKGPKVDGWTWLSFEPDGSPEDVLKRLQKQYPREDDQPDTPEPDDIDLFYSPSGKILLCVNNDKDRIHMYTLSEPKDLFTANFNCTFTKEEDTP